MPTYDPPVGYTAQIPSGTMAFRNVVKGFWGFQRVEIVRDQSRCNQTPSEHCVCRGIDFFTTDLTLGRAVFDWCMTQGDTLGVQSVIFNRRVWGFGNWTERPYSGPSPHTDHVHVGLNIWASQNLTAAMVEQQLPDQGDDDLTPEEHDALVRIDADTDPIPAMNAAIGRIETAVTQPGATPVISNADVERIAKRVCDMLQTRLQS